MQYFCARLLVVCLVDDGKPRKKNLCDYPFILIKARNHAGAFRRALILGKRQECRYKNDKGKNVRWAFVRVEEIKRLPARLDGAEIGSLLDHWFSDSPVPFGKRFLPRRSTPLFDE
jgi:hypothetical protein